MRKKTMKWCRQILFASAGLMLGYCGFVLEDTWIFQHQESRGLERQLHNKKPAGAIRLPPAATGGMIGRLEIPRLRLSVIVMEGDGQRILRRAAGHVPGTSLPGERGNVGISGHRDTFFRPLRNIHWNDLITFTTLEGEYRYRVVSIRVVNPDNVAVLDSTGGEILTLITCHPFYFVGPAPDRFIVRAERVPGGSTYNTRAGRAAIPILPTGTSPRSTD
jgi:sortase A